MNIQELAESAAEIINRSPIDNPNMILELSGKWGDSDSMRLVPPSVADLSPIGSIIKENEGTVLVAFDARDIFAFCVANGARGTIFILPPDDE